MITTDTQRGVLITAVRGATYSFSLVWRDASGTPVDVNGFTARMQLKRTRSRTALSELTLTSPSGGITFSSPTTNGGVNVTISAAQSGTLSDVYFFDLMLTSAGGVVTQLIRGEINFVESVTT